MNAIEITNSINNMREALSNALAAYAIGDMLTARILCDMYRDCKEYRDELIAEATS